MGWPYPHKPIMGWPIDPDHPLSGFEAFWLMLEGSGNKVFDLSGYGNTGTLSEWTSWNVGKFGSILSRGLADGYINIGTLGSFGSNIHKGLTFVCWVKSSITASQMGVFGGFKADELNCFVELNTDENNSTVAGNIRVFLDKDGLAPTRLSGAVSYDTGITDGYYHHLAVVIKPTLNIIEVYIDSKLETFTYKYQNGQASYGNFVQDIYLMGLNISDSLTESFNGLFDIPMFYNRALSASEISQLYREPFCMFKDPDEIALLGGYVEEEVEGIVVLRRRRECA